MKKVAIVDYFSGNIFSVSKAFEHLGCNVTLAKIPKHIQDADYLILPGVGAFGDGMDRLYQRGLIEPILEFSLTERPILGICLGMQLLLSSSEEFGYHKGLDIIKGEVSCLPSTKNQKIPHIGWASLDPRVRSNSKCWDGTILEGVTQEQDLYFVHSFAANPRNNEDWLSSTRFGEHHFCSTLKKGNIYGCQYHPEKSGKVGLSILKSFLEFT